MTTSQNTGDGPTADQIVRDAHRIYAHEGGEAETALRIGTALERAGIVCPDPPVKPVSPHRLVRLANRGHSVL